VKQYGNIETGIIKQSSRNTERRYDKQGLKKNYLCYYHTLAIIDELKIISVKNRSKFHIPWGALIGGN
jgi:hypothetical protein